MKSVTRFAVMLSAGVAIGASLGVAPAMASSAAPSAVQVEQPRDRWDDDEVEGYYRSLRVCERLGRLGERRDRWEDYDCKLVRWGENRGLWRLEVERGDWWDRDDDDDDHDGPWRPRH
jgi:hypothetical protein